MRRPRAFVAMDEEATLRHYTEPALVSAQGYAAEARPVAASQTA